MADSPCTLPAEASDKLLKFLFLFSFGLCSCFANSTSNFSKLPNGIDGCTWGMSAKECKDILLKGGFKEVFDDDFMEHRVTTKKYFFDSYGRIKIGDHVYLEFSENKLFKIKNFDLPQVSPREFIEYFEKKYGKASQIKDPENGSNGDAIYVWSDGFTECHFNFSTHLDLDGYLHGHLGLDGISGSAGELTSFSLQINKKLIEDAKSKEQLNKEKEGKDREAAKKELDKF